MTIMVYMTIVLTIFSVMSCNQATGYTIEFGWILSKNQQFRQTSKYQDVLNTAVEKFGFKTDQAIEAPQSDCNYDYIGYYPDGPAGIKKTASSQKQTLFFTPLLLITIIVQQ